MRERFTSLGPEPVELGIACGTATTSWSAEQPISRAVRQATMTRNTLNTRIRGRRMIAHLERLKHV